jgi:uncharacterized protein with PQ loop repeat
MRYLQTYEQHNEGIKSAVLGAALGASLFANSPTVTAQSLVKPAITNPTSKDGINDAVEQVEGLSNVRKSELNPKDEQLNNILSEIQNKLESGNQEEYKELFDKLSSHVETKYGYKIEPKNLDELSSAGIAEQTKGMSIFEILGWLGSICLAICGLPQAWQSIKDKHSHGISWGFVLLWAFGEIFALAYVYDKLDLPLLLNYATNILILGVILYFKINPKNTVDYDKEVRRFH